MANHCYIVGLIDGNPIFDFGAEAAEYDVCIVPESVDDGLILPAPDILESLR